jgi:hypothetical protein
MKYTLHFVIQIIILCLFFGAIYLIIINVLSKNYSAVAGWGLSLILVCFLWARHSKIVEKILKN